jgi:hypothetical protein
LTKEIAVSSDVGVLSEGLWDRVRSVSVGYQNTVKRTESVKFRLHVLRG